ncbi:MAG: ester cyclase, partial [Bacteroidota bacterium]
MKTIILTGILSLFAIPLSAQSDSLTLETSQISLEEINKEIARNFYQDLWFTNNTDKYADYVAEEYVVHDIGDRKGVTEPAIEQKIIADRFWEGGSWDSKIDYQIAEGDLVATRWTANYQAESFMAKVMF